MLYVLCSGSTVRNQNRGLPRLQRPRAHRLDGIDATPVAVATTPLPPQSGSLTGCVPRLLSPDGHGSVSRRHIVVNLGTVHFERRRGGNTVTATSNNKSPVRTHHSYGTGPASAVSPRSAGPGTRAMAHTFFFSLSATATQLEADPCRLTGSFGSRRVTCQSSVPSVPCRPGPPQSWFRRVGAHRHGPLQTTGSSTLHN